MNNETKSQRIFIGFVFIWSFIFWGLGIFLTLKMNVSVLENAVLLDAFLNGTLNRGVYIIAIFNALAGYGPLLGAIFISVLIPESRRHFKRKFKLKTPFKYALQIIILFVTITMVPVVLLTFKDGLATSLTWSLINFTLLFFVYQFITAGTEEIGWRGYLLPSMLEKRTPWEASVRIGVIWALWHTPIVLFVFYSQGLSVIQILMSFIGFIAGTIAMSTIHTYYYLKTENVLFNMFIHAVSNTLPMIAGMLFASSYVISVFVQILLWVFVIIITKKNKAFFDTLQEQVQSA